MNNGRSSSLFWLLLLGLIFVPLQPLDLNWLIDALIAIALFALTLIAQPVSIIAHSFIWIWSLTKIIHQPFTFYHIVYYLFLALYVVFMILPYIIGIIYAIRNRPSKY